MTGYTTSDVAKLLGLSAAQVRGFARAGFLDPSRGPRGEWLFSFQDLVLLRAAKALAAARIPLRRIRRALKQLKRQLPKGRPLSGLRIAAEGDRIVVADGERAAFDLGTALEDLGRPEEAIEAYRQAIRSDPSLADAYFNLARLYEQTGKRAAALRYLSKYRRLTD